MRNRDSMDNFDSVCGTDCVGKQGNQKTDDPTLGNATLTSAGATNALLSNAKTSLPQTRQSELVPVGKNAASHDESSEHDTLHNDTTQQSITVHANEGSGDVTIIKDGTVSATASEQMSQSGWGPAATSNAARPPPNMALQRLHALPFEELLAHIEQEFAAIENATMDTRKYNFTTSQRNMALNRYINILANEETIFPSPRGPMAYARQAARSRSATTTATSTSLPCSLFKSSSCCGSSATSTITIDTTKTATTTKSTPRYINANTIDLNVLPLFVACQAPPPEVIPAFLRTLVEQDVKLVLMLTDLSESGMLKAHRYWPENDEEELHIGPEKGTSTGNRGCQGSAGVSIRVTRDPNNPYTHDPELQIWRRPLLIHLSDGAKRTRNSIREDRCSQTNLVHAHRIVQYQYTGWPDQGVPSTTDPFEKLLQIIRDYVQQQQAGGSMDANNVEAASNRGEMLPAGPVLVHCSAGIGRTGTLIGAYVAVMLLERGEFVPQTMMHLLRQMRAARFGMVQRVEQYIYMYQIVLRHAGFDVDRISRELLARASRAPQARFAMVREQQLLRMFPRSVASSIVRGTPRGL